MEKGKEFISPGIIYVPWTIQLEIPNELKGSIECNPIVLKFGQSKKYDIIFVKEFIRRKKSTESIQIDIRILPDGGLYSI